ncbi:MAG: glycosyltransferase, partial [Ignavibacteriaceae bacterium]
MKVLILADAGSAHTIKWVNALLEKGLDIYLFSLREFNIEDYPPNNKLCISTLHINKNIFNKIEGSIYKFIYLKALPAVKKIIRDYKPEIVHAHYASSYGIIGALTGFHPYFVSVWGSDIYLVPQKNIIYKKLIEYTLRKADRISSTSGVMTKQINKFTNKTIEIIPFGIDITKFKSSPKMLYYSPDEIVIGTIKTLEEKYGIRYLIEAFKKVKDRHPELQIKLLIVGSGTIENILKKIVEDLNLSDYTLFTGFISPDEVPVYQNLIDIYVALSLEESFGVAVLEASACGKPVIVSNVGGLPEVVENKVTGFVVEKENPEAAAEAIEKLLLEPGLRKKMGQNGRKRVEQLYNW